MEIVRRPSHRVSCSLLLLSEVKTQARKCTRAREEQVLGNVIFEASAELARRSRFLAEQQKEGSGTGAKFQTTHIIGQKGKKNFYLVGLKLGSAVKKLNLSSFFGLNSFRTNLNHADCKTEPLRSWQKRIHITTEHSTTGYYQSAQNPPATFLLPLAFISSLLLWIINNLVRPNHVDMGADLI